MRRRRHRRLRHFCALNPMTWDGGDKRAAARRTTSYRPATETAADDGRHLDRPCVRPSIRRPRARALLRKVQERRADRCRRTQWPESGRASGRRGGGRCETGRGREGARSRGEEGEGEGEGGVGCGRCDSFRFFPGRTTALDGRRDALCLLPAPLSIARRVSG